MTEHTSETPEEESLKAKVSEFLDVVKEWSSLEFQEKLALHHGKDDEPMIHREDPA